MPVNAPWEAAVEPIFVPALKTKLLFRGESFPRLSTIVMPGKTEYFGDAEVRFDGLRVRNRSYLASSVQVLRETFDRGIREGGRGGIVLVVVLQRQRVFGGSQIIV